VETIESIISPQRTQRTQRKGSFLSSNFQPIATKLFMTLPFI